MTMVTARVTVVVGRKGEKVEYRPGKSFDVPTAEAERLMRVGAVSIGGLIAAQVPIPAVKQPTSIKSGDGDGTGSGDAA